MDFQPGVWDVGNWRWSLFCAMLVRYWSLVCGRMWNITVKTRRRITRIRILMTVRRDVAALLALGRCI